MIKKFLNAGMRALWLFPIIILFSISSSTVRAEDAECKYCGMKRSQFPHSWMIITHSDGSVEMTCSVHCAAIEMAIHTDKPITRLTVADYDTHEQIPAESAFWVIGGDRLGVMTARGKWAFETEAGADRFVENHGGRHADFNAVMKAAFEDMYQDTLMIRKKRRMMMLRKNFIDE